MFNFHLRFNHIQRDGVEERRIRKRGNKGIAWGTVRRGEKDRNKIKGRGKKINRNGNGQKQDLPETLRSWKFGLSGGCNSGTEEYDGGDRLATLNVAEG